MIAGSCHLGTPSPFADAWVNLLNDLNVPGALGCVFSKIKDVPPSRESWPALWFILDALGLTLPPPAGSETIEIPAEIKALAGQRWQAKQSKDWAASDVLRKQITELGWLIKDSKEGYAIAPK